MVEIVGYSKKVRKRVTCGRCGAVLEYTPSEVKKARYTCMGDSSGHDYVECPNCPGYWAARIPGTSY